MLAVTIKLWCFVVLLPSMDGCFAGVAVTSAHGIL
jgi:hypothetical protein